MLRTLGKSALIAIGFGLLAVPGLQAQQSPPAQQEQQQQQSVELSDEEMEKFVRMYVAVDSIRQRMMSRTAMYRRMGDEEKAEEAFEAASDTMEAKLTEHGYTPEDYTRLVKALNANRKMQAQYEAKKAELGIENKKKTIIRLPWRRP